MPTPPESRDVAALKKIMADLRTPGSGCPWDLEQSFETIAPYTIEEAYEVADAIERGDLTGLRDELGDLLLQVVYHAQLAAEANAFRFDDVVAAICEKMIRRHPHVYGDDEAGGRPKLAKGFWEATKARERASGSNGEEGEGEVLAGVARALPALSRAVKLQARAARVGFDWPNAGPVFAKLREEIGEIEEAIGRGDKAGVEGEIGDLLFACANLARHLEVDPEAALTGANSKFIRRFAHIEKGLEANGKSPAEASLEEMEALWVEAKASEGT